MQTVAPDATPVFGEAEPLPADLADPLHLPEAIEPWVWGCGCAVLLLLAILLVLWWLYRVGSKSPAPAPAQPRKQRQRPRRSGRGIGKQIDALTQAYAEDPRQGCHELATLLRDHFARRHRQPLEHLTAREIGGRIKNRDVANLFAQLAELQFGRDDPSPQSFRAICHDARWLAEGRRKSRQRDDQEPSP